MYRGKMRFKLESPERKVERIRRRTLSVSSVMTVSRYAL
jgi:hypothetical protein